MQILKIGDPVIAELSREDITAMHFGLEQYKTWLKHLKGVNKNTKRKRLRHVNRMIVLVELLI
jgi:hypothetical protein